MALTAANVRVAVTGAAYRAPAGTALPTGITAPLAAGYTDQGYLGDTGIVQTINASTEPVTAWDNPDTVRTVQTSHEVTYTFTLLEYTANTLDVVYGNHTTGATVISGAEHKPAVWVFQIIDGPHRFRVCLPDAQIVNVGDTTYGNQAATHEITLNAYPDRSGVKAYVYADVGEVPTPKQPTTLIVGDSNTVGQDSTAGNSWATQLGCAPPVWAANGAGVWAKFALYGNRSLLTSYLPILATQPGTKHVVIMLGTNDTRPDGAVQTPGGEIGSPAAHAVLLDGLSDWLISEGAATVRWMTIPPRASTAPLVVRNRMVRWNDAVMLTRNPVDARGAFPSGLLAPEYALDENHLNAAAHTVLANYVSADICGL